MPQSPPTSGDFTKAILHASQPTDCCMFLRMLFTSRVRFGTIVVAQPSFRSTSGKRQTPVRRDLARAIAGNTVRNNSTRRRRVLGNSASIGRSVLAVQIDEQEIVRGELLPVDVTIRRLVGHDR